jgi:tRNA(Ile)-lysidine synthase
MLEQKVYRTIRRFGMVRPGDRVLVSVSGGADSTALLVVLDRLSSRLGATLAAAHLDHGLRGEESDEDARAVAALCERVGVPLQSEKVDMRAAARGRNLEEAAREARIDFLRRASAGAGASRVALGHTLNDQAETVLMRLVRGTGGAGLAAIHPVVDGVFIRPLIESTREEVVRYLRERGVSWREDTSNRDLRFRRNRVRAELIPYLQEHFNPKVVQALGRHAAAAREEAEFLERTAAEAYGSLRRAAPAGIALDAAGLGALDPALRAPVLRIALVEARGSLRGITARHLEGLLGLCRAGQSGRRVRLPGGTEAVRLFDRLLIGEQPARAARFSYDLPIPGTVRVVETGLELTARLVRAVEPAPQRPEAACLDADLLPPSLTVRSRRPGDVYGRRGSRKVKKLLIDARIPVPARETLPMVAAGDGVVWIPGFPPARYYAARATTPRCVVLEAASTADRGNLIAGNTSKRRS